jgi:hypothetical protein
VLEAGEFDERQVQLLVAALDPEAIAVDARDFCRLQENTNHIYHIYPFKTTRHAARTGHEN